MYMYNILINSKTKQTISIYNFVSDPCFLLVAYSTLSKNLAVN